MQDKSSKNLQCDTASGDSWLRSILGDEIADTKEKGLEGQKQAQEQDQEKGQKQAQIPGNTIPFPIKSPVNPSDQYEAPLQHDFGIEISQLVAASRQRALANKEKTYVVLEKRKQEREVRCPAKLVVEKIYSNEEYESLAELYFASCEAEDEIPTMSGLALSLGLSSVSGLERLGMRNPELRNLLGRAFLLIQFFYEKALLVKGMSDGAKFVLKNIPDGFPEDSRDQINLSSYWRDTKQIAFTGTMQTNVVHDVLGENITPEKAYEKLIRGERVFDEESTLPEVWTP